MSLGFWQLQRAEEKSAINALREARTQEPSMRLGPETPPDLEAMRYRPVFAEGLYDTTHQFLLDNQLKGQEPGYHVLTPLRLAGSNQAILVNRGWVPQGPSRAALPDIGLGPPRKIRIQGKLDYLHRVGFRLKGAEIPAAGWPSVVQLPEADQLAERLGYPLLPYQVLLDPDAESGYLRVWHAAPLDPGKNLGYALQWFLFAAGAAFLFLRHTLKRGAR
ncbi:MAG: SURF1 family protein [Methylococcaceae bacterium]|nr:SURF1 family protein [Methylococcaceae bacterium]